jgi:hypothetical protein
MRCWNCAAEIQTKLGVRILNKDSCPKCDRDLHVCKNCRFYDPHYHNECRETQAEWVRDKEKANYCDYFDPQQAYGLSSKGSPSASDVKAALDRLFKK